MQTMRSRLWLVVGLAFLGTSVQADEPLLLEFYEVTDILAQPPDFPAPRLGLDGLEASLPADGPTRTIDQLIATIQKTIAPEAWKKDGPKIDAANGKLVIRATAGMHARIAAHLKAMRDRARRLYHTEIRMLPVNATGLRTLGFDPESRTRSRVINRKHADAWVEDQKQPPTLSRLSTRDGQRSHFLTIEQSAYIADAVLNEALGILEPKIEVLNEGYVFELTAEKRAEQQTLLTWKVTTSKAAMPQTTAKIGDAFEITLPELELRSIQGRSLLGAESVLAIRAPSGVGEIEGEAILLVTAVEATPR